MTRAPAPPETTHDEGIRIVVTGKGGVGKTTISAVLARLLAREGRRTLAVDADAQLNLAAALGMPRAEAEALVPLSRHDDYIAEKTGARPGDAFAPLLRLNPDVDDVVDRFGRRAPDDVRFLAMGTLSGAGGGCLCPENTLLERTINAIGLRDGEAIVLDTQAGVEHFGRALARGFGHAVVVTDPTYGGVGVALAAGRLARDLGIGRVHLAVNRIRTPDDRRRARSEIEARRDGLEFDSWTWLPYDEEVLAAEPSVELLLSSPSAPFIAAVHTLARSVTGIPTEAVPVKVVIIGSGPAGIVAAEELRAADPSVELEMVTQEPYPPYSPPAMADHFVTGRSEALFWKGPDIAERLAITYRSPARVAGIDPSAREVRLDDGARLSYDALLIASGSRLHAPIEGAELPGVHDFKSLAAAEAIMARVRRHEATSALIVGAGFIGMEIALLLADLGVRVAIVGRRTWVMPRMLDAETAEIAGRAMAGRGIELRLGVEATGFVERDGRAVGVRLADDRILTADLYIAATGVKPNLAFLDGSGIAHNWGITVNDHLRTNVPGIWAAGDVVEAADRATGRPFVHAIFPNAVDQARVVAANVAGGDVTYPGAESMNSLKHLGLPIMAVGAMEGSDELRWRVGDELRKVFLDDGRIVGFRFAGDISGGGLLRSFLLRREDVRRFGQGLVVPGFGLSRVVLPAMAI